MNWWQAIVTIMLGNLIVLRAHGARTRTPGRATGSRSPSSPAPSFGIHGSNVPALMRALVACGWFGIQTWIGGQAIYTMLKVVVPAAGSCRSRLALGFLAFWLLNMIVDRPRQQAIKCARSLGRTVPDRVGPRLARLGRRARGRLRTVLSQPEPLHVDRRLPGGVRALAHRDGRLLGHPGAEHPGPVALRAGSEGAGVGTDPRPADDDDAVLVHRRGGHLGVGRHLRRADLGSRCSCSRGSSTPLVVLIALFALLIATLTTNVAANVVAPANGFANLWPARINFARGGIITGIIGIAIMPWRLLENADRYTGLARRVLRASWGPSPASSSRTTGWCGAGGSRCRTSMTADGIYGRWNVPALVALATGIARGAGGAGRAGAATAVRLRLVRRVRRGVRVLRDINVAGGRRRAGRGSD